MFPTFQRWDRRGAVGGLGRLIVMAGIDTVRLRMTFNEYGGGFTHVANLLEGCKPNSGIINGVAFSNIEGRLGNLKVKCWEWGVQVEGSLPKWLRGDNMQTLTRGAVRDAVGKLSDELHLPMELARVGRCDIGANLITKHAPFMYYQYMGQLARYNRTETDGAGLRYRTKGGAREFVFYDKVLEVLRHGGEIPPLYQGRNVLRLEKRTEGFNKATAGRFKVFHVLGRTLYEESFYIAVMNDYKDTYDSITKTHGGKFKTETNMKTKREFLMHLAKVGFIHEYGGNVANISSYLENERLRGNITSKQKCDMMKGAVELAGISAGVEVEGCIDELDGLIKRDLAFFP